MLFVRTQAVPFRARLFRSSNMSACIAPATWSRCRGDACFQAGEMITCMT